MSAPTDSHPHGLLRKVTSVSKAGKKMNLRTTPATLEEAVENGQIHVSRTLSTKDLRSVVPMKKGIFLKDPSPARAEMAAPEGYEEAGEKLDFDLFDVVLYDHDGNLETEEDQIKATGKISVVPSFNFTWTSVISSSAT